MCIRDSIGRINDSTISTVLVIWPAPESPGHMPCTKTASLGIGSLSSSRRSGPSPRQPEVGTQSADAEDNELRPVRHAGKDGSVDQRIGRAFSADRQVSSATSDWVNLIELRSPGRNDPRLLRRSSATVRSQRWPQMSNGCCTCTLDLRSPPSTGQQPAVRSPRHRGSAGRSCSDRRHGRGRVRRRRS